MRPESAAQAAKKKTYKLEWQRRRRAQVIAERPPRVCSCGAEIPHVKRMMRVRCVACSSRSRVIYEAAYYARRSGEIRANARAWYAANTARAYACNRRAEILRKGRDPEGFAERRRRNQRRARAKKLDHYRAKGRHEAAMRDARRATVPSSLTLRQRAAVLVAACFYCGRNDVARTVDHFQPIVRGGHDCLHNSVAACLSCNSRKRDRPPSDQERLRFEREVPWASEECPHKEEEANVA